MISVMTPAPTVWPPSRMAKRNSFSIAIGTINSQSIVHAVPGHHHLLTLGQIHYPRHVCRPEIKLRTIALEKRRVTAAFLFLQDINLPLNLV